MWQLLALGSVFASTIDSVVDKFALVRYEKIDNIIATFHRVLMFFGFTVIGALSGVFGDVQLQMHLALFGMALLWSFSAHLYTFLVKQVEITVAVGLGYMTPFLFLIIDIFVIRIDLTAWQLLGVMLLPLGALAFIVEGRGRSKMQTIRSVTPAVWGVFLYDTIVVGADYYVFQWLHHTHGMNEISYLINLWWIIFAILLFYVTSQGKLGKLFTGITHSGYLRSVSVSKGFDFIAAILWLGALARASASQVDAMDAFAPLVLFVVVFITQRILRINLNEDLQISRIRWKIIGIILLIIGGILVS